MTEHHSDPQDVSDTQRSPCMKAKGIINMNASQLSELATLSLRPLQSHELYINCMSMGISTVPAESFERPKQRTDGKYVAHHTNKETPMTH